MTFMTPPCRQVAEPSHEPLPDHGNSWRLQVLYGDAHHDTKARGRCPSWIEVSGRPLAALPGEGWAAHRFGYLSNPLQQPDRQEP
jgi:hypothetical protein